MTERREEIALLATAVHGWTYWDGQADYDGPPVTVFTDWGIDDLKSVSVYEDGSDDVTRQWNPWEWDADAVGLLRKLDENGLRFELVNTVRGTVICRLWPTKKLWITDGFSGESGDMRHAICAAALAWAREQKGGKV